MGKGRDADRQQVQVQGTSLFLTSTYFFSFTLYIFLEDTGNVKLRKLAKIFTASVWNSRYLMVLKRLWLVSYYLFLLDSKNNEKICLMTKYA